MMLYFAGAEHGNAWKCLQACSETNILVSYYYLTERSDEKGLEMLRGMKALGANIFLDSGAFSAKHSGKEIDVHQFADFVHAAGDLVSEVASLDVIGDHEGSAVNQRILEKAGLKPIPVFHYGEPFEVLGEMAREYERLAIGGVARMGNKKSLLRPFLTKCFGVLLENGSGGNQKLCHKVHGFGCTFDWVMREFPFFSVDSTYWLHGAISFRMLQTSGVFYKGHDIRSTKGVTRQTWHGADTKGQLNYVERNLHNIRQIQALRDNVTELWKLRGITWD